MFICFSTIRKSVSNPVRVPAYKNEKTARQMKEYYVPITSEDPGKVPTRRQSGKERTAKSRALAKERKCEQTGK